MQKVRDDMTREDVIFCEKTFIGETNCIDCKFYGRGTCQSRRLHKMAIEALEQEPKSDNRVKTELNRVKTELDGVKPELDGVKTELENCITIDGIRYIAEEPKLKTVHKDGEVVIGGFREIV